MQYNSWAPAAFPRKRGLTLQKARSRGKPAVLLGGFTEDKKERNMKTEVRNKRKEARSKRGWSTVNSLL